MRCDAFKRAVEAQDHAAMVAAMTPDAVLWSPVSHKPFEGREAVAELFGILLRTFEAFEYEDALTGEGDSEALVFRARVGDRDLQGLDHFRFAQDGLIQTLTVMIRPASGLMALGAAVGPQLAAAAQPAGGE